MTTDPRSLEHFGQIRLEGERYVFRWNGRCAIPRVDSMLATHGWGITSEATKELVHVRPFHYRSELTPPNWSNNSLLQAVKPAMDYWLELGDNDKAECVREGRWMPDRNCPVSDYVNFWPLGCLIWPLCFATDLGEFAVGVDESRLLSLRKFDNETEGFVEFHPFPWLAPGQ